ncbi:MAG: branched-chain amino acid ABC transporter permease [Verrucomicrobia bacterium]|nr:branched-chain amino acid ABC transporter permease [Verrucomicrobiota bacterium]
MIPRSQIVLAGALASAGLLAVLQPRIDDYFALIISNIGINIILAVSLNLINGYTGQFSLGHAGFMAVGAYTTAAITMFGAPKFAPALTQGAGIHALFPIALIGGGLTAALAGVLVGAPSLRLKGDYLAIVTLGFGEIIRVLFRNVDSLGGALGLNSIPAYTNLFWVYAFAALTVYVVVSMVNSTYGRGFLAVHDDEIAAEAMGINTTRYKITAFVVGAFFAGVAGGLYGHSILTIAPTGFDFMRSIEIVVMVILGGMGNTAGVIIAAVLLTLLPEGLRMLAGVRVDLPFAAPFNNLKWIADTRMIIYSLLVIVLMLARPQGLFNWANRGAAKSKF